jgi:cytochrome c-type biogenesis protein CcmH
MTGLLLASALLVVAVLALLLWPLLKARVGHSDESPHVAPHVAPHLAVLREQAAQLEAERRTGVLDEAQHAAAQAELARRVLEEEAQVAASSARAPLSNSSQVLRQSRPQGRRTAWLLVLALPLVVAGLYTRLGQPQVLQAQAQAEAAPPGAPTAKDIEAMVKQMADRLENGPPEQTADPTAWAMLARSMAALQRYPEADRAYLRAIALAPRNAQLLADRADLLLMLRGPQGRIEADSLIAQALQIDPQHLKALALAGSAAMERQDWPAGVAYLERAQRVAPAGSEFAAELARSLAAAREAGGLPAQAVAQITAAAPTASVSNTAPPAAAALALNLAQPAPALTPAQAQAFAVSGSVNLLPAFKSVVPSGSTLFIYARAVQGPRMPLAVLRLPVGSWPVTFKLDDALAMSPELRLSQFKEVVVQARISRSGEAIAQTGDWVGQSAPLKPGSQGVSLVIDRVQP